MNNRRPNDNKDAGHRVNEEITARQVRIVGEDIESTVVSIQEALRLARER